MQASPLTPAEYRIRPAVAADMEGILVLDRATESLPHWPELEYATAIGQDPTVDKVNRNVFVAEFSSELIGLTVVSLVTIAGEIRSELESVAVAGYVRRLGIGLALCHQAIEWAQTHGAESMDLEVRSQSSGAITLYEGLGFVAAGRRAAYYRNPVDDAILMRLTFT